MYVYVCSVAELCLTLCNPMEPAKLLCPWDFSGKKTGVGCHFLLQQIFSTQGSDPYLLPCRWILYHISHSGSPYVCMCVNICEESVNLREKWIVPMCVSTLRHLYNSYDLHFSTGLIFSKLT